MVILTDEEKSMLQGEQGHVRQACMQYLVEMCEIAGAERLVDLDGTGDMHTPGLNFRYHPFTFEEVKQLAEEGAKFKIPTFAIKPPSRVRRRYTAGRAAICATGPETASTTRSSTIQPCRRK